MPTDVVAKINGEVRKTFADPEVRKNFLDRNISNRSPVRRKS